MSLKEMVPIAFIILTEVLGWALVPPFLPYLAGEYGATPLIVGLLFASYSVCLFFSAPITGNLSDRFGRKPLLLICQFFTLISFLMLGFANNLVMIFLSRMLNGLFSGMTVIMAYISDKAKEKRASYFNYAEAVKNSGYVIGPLIGGVFSLISYSIPPLIAAGISFIGLIVTYNIIRETLTSKKSLSLKLNDFLPVGDYADCFKKKSLRTSLIEYFIVNFGYTVITSSIGLYVKYQLGLGPLEVGASLVIVALFGIAFQLAVIPRLIRRFKVKRVKVAGLILIISSTLMMYFINSITSFYGIMSFFGLGLVLTKPMIISEISNKAVKKDQGITLGVVSSLGSIGSMIAPIIGGLIIGFRPELIGLIASIITFGGFVYGLTNKIN